MYSRMGRKGLREAVQTAFSQLFYGDHLKFEVLGSVIKLILMNWIVFS
jgi:hypothetical protein